MLNNQNLFFAEVRDINDPFKSGRVKIRIYGNHDDEQNIKDEHLAWGMPIQPITSAATSKVGVIPTGMIVGSRVLGVFIDEARQYPIILGTYSRGSKLLNNNVVDGGQEILDPKQKGVDTPSQGHPEDNNKGNTPNAVGVGAAPIDPYGAKYNQAPTVDNGSGPQGLMVARDKFAPNASETTVAAVDPSVDLPNAVKQVGTSGEVLKNMMSLLDTIRSIMTMTNQTQSNNGNNNGSDSYAITAMTDALSIFANTYGFDYVINILTFTFKNNNYTNLEPIYDDIITESIINLIMNGIKYNFQNFPYFVIPKANLLPQNIPVPTPLSSTIPDFYVQQFYSLITDPYPGYIQWLGPMGDYVYTIRTSNDPNYNSPEDSVIGIAQTTLVSMLSPYFTLGAVTVNELNMVLDVVVPETQINGTNATLGNNSNSNILSMALMLLGIIGAMVNKSQDVHLPTSVLNIGSMSNTIMSFTKNIAILQQMKNLSMSAFAVPSSLSALNSLTTGSFGSLSTGGGGGLSASSISALLSSGMTQPLITSLNTVSINNPNLSSNTITTIASVTSSLSAANVSTDQIISIQNLLSEIVED